MLDFFVSLFTSFLTPNFLTRVTCISWLLYPTALELFITIFESISQVPEVLLSDKSGFLITSSMRVRNSVLASFALPPSPKILERTFS